MDENFIATAVVDCAYKIHKCVGPGLLESAYQAMLIFDLQERGFQVDVEVPIPVTYKNLRLDTGFRADMLINDLVIIELKSVEQVLPVHKKQLLTYLCMADKRLGLLINFGAPLIKYGITRIANHLTDADA